MQHLIQDYMHCDLESCLIDLHCFWSTNDDGKDAAHCNWFFIYFDNLNLSSYFCTFQWKLYARSTGKLSLIFRFIIDGDRSDSGIDSTTSLLLLNHFVRRNPPLTVDLPLTGCFLIWKNWLQAIKLCVVWCCSSQCVYAAQLGDEIAPNRCSGIW